MSTSLLYHRFGIVGYRYVSQIFEPGITTFRIEQPRERLPCSHCHSEDVWAQGGVERNFRALPIGKQPIFINFKVPCVLCFNCGKVRQVKIAFADPKKHHTHAFGRYALELSRLMTIQDVADHLVIGWDVIKEIQVKHLQRRFGKPKLHKLKQIANFFAFFVPSALACYYTSHKKVLACTTGRCNRLQRYTPCTIGINPPTS
jgi:transposase